MKEENNNERIKINRTECTFCVCVLRMAQMQRKQMHFGFKCMKRQRESIIQLPFDFIDFMKNANNEQEDKKVFIHIQKFKNGKEMNWIDENEDVYTVYTHTYVARCSMTTIHQRIFIVSSIRIVPKSNKIA